MSKPVNSIEQDPQYKAMKRNLKHLSKGELIKILFDTYGYMAYYKNSYLSIMDKLKEESSKQEGAKDESNVA